VKRDRARTAVVLVINGFIAWWLTRLTIEEYSILPMVNLLFTGVAVFALLLGILLDFGNPKWGCAWNITIWWMATFLQAWVAFHARWPEQQWSEQKVGFLLSLPITLFLCLVYFMSWRDARRGTA